MMETFGALGSVCAVGLVLRESGPLSCIAPATRGPAWPSNLARACDGSQTSSDMPTRRSHCGRIRTIVLRETESDLGFLKLGETASVASRRYPSLASDEHVAESANPLDSLAPPARLELATRGLGKRTKP